jgi:hypothetical protein
MPWAWSSVVLPVSWAGDDLIAQTGSAVAVFSLCRYCLCKFPTSVQEKREWRVTLHHYLRTHRPFLGHFCCYDAQRLWIVIEPETEIRQVLLYSYSGNLNH